MGKWRKRTRTGVTENNVGLAVARPLLPARDAVLYAANFSDEVGWT